MTVCPFARELWWDEAQCRGRDPEGGGLVQWWADTMQFVSDEELPRGEAMGGLGELCGAGEEGEEGEEGGVCGVGGMDKGNEKDEEEDEEDEEEEEKEEREEDRLDWSCWDPAGEAELAARGDIKTLQQRAQDAVDLLPGVLGRRKEETIAVVCHWGVINRLTGLSVDNGEVAVCTLSGRRSKKGRRLWELEVESTVESPYG